MKRNVYFVGSESEVAHHAAPLENEDSLAVSIVDADKVVDAAQAGDVAVFFSEHFDRFRKAVVELKARNVGTIYLIDGILEWRNAWENSRKEPACPFTMRPVLCHKVAAIGASQARVLAGWDNPGKIEVVGIPRLDDLAQSWKRLESQTPNENGPFRVLVATAKTPGFTEHQIETTIRSLAELKAYFDSIETIQQRPLQVVWRLTGELDQTIGVQNQLTDLCGAELHNAIEECDAFITTPSTAMLESMLQHKPTALLNYHQCPVYVPSAWNIQSPESIEPVLSQLANPTAAHLHFQNAVLFDTLQVSEPATARLVQLIQSMFATMQPLLKSGKPIEFDANLLPNAFLASQLSGAPCKMDHSSVFVDYAEFSEAMETTQLQSELGHARREIDHLHRVQEGLRAELAEAHSIFEQIHQHPIAGPIVRIRDRVIQFMKRNRKEN